MTTAPTDPGWCTTRNVSPALLAQLPEEAEDKACLCAACVARFTAAPPGPVSRA